MRGPGFPNLAARAAAAEIPDRASLLTQRFFCRSSCWALSCDAWQLRERRRQEFRLRGRGRKKRGRRLGDAARGRAGMESQRHRAAIRRRLALPPVVFSGRESARRFRGRFDANAGAILAERTAATMEKWTTKRERKSLRFRYHGQFVLLGLVRPKTQKKNNNKKKKIK